MGKYADFGFIGFDLWQGKGGTIFDNIIICDDKAEADAFAAKWKALSTVEKEEKKKEAMTRRTRREATTRRRMTKKMTRATRRAEMTKKTRRMTRTRRTRKTRRTKKIRKIRARRR